MAEATPTIVCPACGKRFRWRPEFAGRRARCAACRRVLQLPEQEDGPVLALDDAPAPAPAGSGAELRFAADGAGGATCPSCHAPVAANAVICVNCGLNLKTGEVLASVVEPASPQEPALAPEAPAPPPPPPAPEPLSAPTKHEAVTLADILKTPLEGDAPADAFVLALGWFGWSFAIVFSSIAVFLFGFLGFIPFLAVVASALGWMARRYMSVVMQHESGAMLAEVDLPKLTCLGVFLLVSGIAYGPVLIVILAAPTALGPQKVLVPLLIVAGAVWALLYWPMGVAMAGAYQTYNPVAVLRKVAGTFRTYVVILMFLAVFVPVVVALSFGVQLVLTAILPPLIGGLIAAVIGSTITQYAVVCQFAMMGRLLRKYRNT